MRRCTVHVGMHKTGTSSIQRSLKGFADDSLVYYEDHKGRANHAGTIFDLVGSSGLDNRPDFSRARSLGERKNLRPVNFGVREIFARSVERLEGRDLLLSAEGTMFLSAAELEALSRLLSDHFEEVAIVAYVRSPAAYMASLFQQLIKGGTAARFDLQVAYPNYRSSFAKFDVAFGRENVRLWKFEPKSFPGGCVVQDFCARLNIALPAERIVRVNESLPRQILALLYIQRRFGGKAGIAGEGRQAGERLGAYLAELGNAKMRFSPEIFGPILQRNQADVEWMEARLGESLQEDLGEQQPGDVRSEADLIALEPEGVSRLLALLGDAAPPGVKGETPEELALLVQALTAKARTAGDESASLEAGGTLNSGRIMRASPDIIVGWAIGADFGRPVEVVLLVNGNEVARTEASKPRPALRDRGMHPSGLCGFAFRFEPEKVLQPGDLVEVQPVGADFRLANSPCAITTS